MKLTDEESATVKIIKWLLQEGCYERADKLAEAFLELAQSDAAARRRACALLRIARERAA